MKKTVRILLVLLLMFSLAACGSDTPDSPRGSSAPASDSGSAAADAPAQKEMTFTEAVAVDNDLCTIRITGIDPDNLWGYTLNAYLENKSADKTYMFSVSSAAINGVQCDPLFASEVAAGKKSNESISFSDSTLSDNGVGDYTDIELTFRVYDSNDWMADNAAQETIHIYPYGEDQASAYVREAQPDNIVLVDNESVTAIVTGFDPDNFWGYAVGLYLVNKTDSDLMFSADDVSVNGYMTDPLYAVTVSAGKCAFSSMTWFDSDFEQNQITQVSEIEFLLNIRDADDWLADPLVSEIFTLQP